MKTINAFYIKAAFFVVLCNNSKIFCKEIDEEKIFFTSPYHLPEGVQEVEKYF